MPARDHSRVHRTIPLVVAIVLGARLPVSAGPPFVSDDPEPTETRQWEIYTGYAGETDDASHGATAFSELNWGVLRNVQLSLSVPYGVVAADSERHAGLEDIQFGVKLRFLRETPHAPEAALYPVVIIPSGDAGRHLGDGASSFFLPVWLQKRVGMLTVYGGGGIWNRGGAAPARWAQTGFVAQLALGKRVAIGAEAYHVGARAGDEPAYDAVAIGGSQQVGKRHRILLSLGRSYHGAPHSRAYVTLETVTGPR